MLRHGLQKLQGFEEMKAKFMNFMGLGMGTSLGLTIFAELACAALIVVGLFTRLASIPLIVAMSVALFMAHKGEMFGEGEMAALYLGCYIAILILGPGRYSLDAMISKK